LNQQITQEDLKSYAHKIIRTNRLPGLLFIIMGVFCILSSNYIITKIGLVLILLGLFLFFLTTKKSVKIIQIIFVWTLIVFFITINVSVEILFILTFLGFLIIKEITDQSTSTQFKNRLNFLIFLFLLFFIYIVVKRIINF